VPRFIVPTLLLLVASATPAFAQVAGTAVDEPANLALFGLGLVGLIVGRHAARKRD
jgi:hypothetical protein